MKKVGIILNNIGSPSTPTPESVEVYLKEFLMDKEIITIPFIIRYLLVNWIIVPRRKVISSQKYQKIWRSESPLIEISKSFAQKVQQQLNQTKQTEYVVKLGMRYGQPSIESCLKEFKQLGIEDIFLAPLYPQYSRATTYSAEEKTKELIHKIFNNKVHFKTLPAFYAWPSFNQLSAKKLNEQWQTQKWDHILFSFHGLPESQIKKTEGCLVGANCCEQQNSCQKNCYRAQCFYTAKQIAKELNLQENQYTVCFQSRLGRAKWIQPASTDIVKQLAEKNVKNILVQTPSFVTDCLETLEEISIELKKEFLQHGGHDLKLVDCLNDDSDWASEFAEYIDEVAQVF